MFNTSLSGYQEIVTDPSYAGQLIAFTYPHIGNYGVNDDDYESTRPHCGGVVVRDLTETPSNWRAERSLDDLLRHHRVPGISGVDTRRLTRHLRGHGALPGAFGTDESAVRVAAAAARRTDGIDLVAGVTTAEPYVVGDADAPFSVVAYDFGIKRTILRNLVAVGVPGRGGAGVDARGRGARPCARTACSSPTARATRRRSWVQPTPCARWSAWCRCSASASGHQILGLALGARTTKLPFGHHGANHPVRHVSTGRVEITSQNHNYAVDADSVGVAAGSVEITHVNLNDGVVEGFRLLDAPAFGVQHHPEAGPGPHDARYLFDDFTDLMTHAGTVAYAEAHRHRVDPRDRLRADRDRAGVRVRLLGHPGVPGAARRGLPRGPRQLEPRDDHDRPRVRRRHLRRAARRRRA